MATNWLSGHKRSAFMFVVRASDGCVYGVRRGESLGVPGGKGEPADANDLSIAVREFVEETGQLPPGITRAASGEYFAEAGTDFYKFVAAGDVHHACTYFYRVVPDAACAALATGPSPEAGTGEDSTEWVDVAASKKFIRMHILRGLALIRRADASVLRPRPHPARWPAAADKNRPAN